MSKRDGGEKKDNKPKISLVVFGDIDDDFSYYILRYLKTFITSFDSELNVIPSFPLIRKPNPPITTLEGRELIFFKEIENIHGDIVLGVTDIGFWGVSPPRFFFGTGGNARGLVSLYRFKNETSNKTLLKERVGKEVIKILGRACHVGDCQEKDCILIYHWKLDDFDMNRHVCENCRKKFAYSLKRILDNPSPQ